MPFLASMSACNASLIQAYRRHVGSRFSREQLTPHMYIILLFAAESINPLNPEQ